MVAVDQQALLMCIVAAIVIERLLEAFGEPICNLIGSYGVQVHPDAKRLIYMIIGSAVGWATTLNAFPVFTGYPVVGQALTALLIGSGSQVIHALITALNGLGE